MIADASGFFAFHGPLPARPVSIYAISTLNDPAFPNRQGSSSQFSVPVGVLEDSSPLVEIWLPFVIK